MKIYRSAFTLIELLVVITIIGLISSVALLVLKDTTEIKALSYTKKMMVSVKKGIADIDSDGYMRGFVNDFGTMPPHVHFLRGKKDVNNSFNFVKNSSGEEKLARYRFVNMTKQVGTKFPAPFMPETAIDLDDKIKKVLFVGYHGGYLNSENNSSLKDGWQVDITMKTDMNISIDNDDGEEFLTLISAGSDRLSDDDGSSLIRKEFDFAQEEGSIEELYSDDYNQTYRKNSFLISSLDIDVDLEVDDANETAIFIYSPMLYYVENSENKSCSENNETHADCNAIPEKYIPYYSFDKDFIDDTSGDRDGNVSWHIGLMKQELYFNDKNESRLFINKNNILTDANDIDAYDFNTTTDNNISDSIFFGNISVDINNTSYSSVDKDKENPFYMYAGTKIISIWYRISYTGNWIKQESFAQDFKPNTNNTIKNADN